MNSNVVAALLLLVLGGAMYALGRAHRPRTPWEDGYRQGVADTTKSMFKHTVRAVELAKNAAPGRFRPRMPFGKVRGSAPAPVVPLKDELTIPVDNPIVGRKPRHSAVDLDDDTTVRVLRLPPLPPDTEAAA